MGAFVAAHVTLAHVAPRLADKSARVERMTIHELDDRGEDVVRNIGKPTRHVDSIWLLEAFTVSLSFVFFFLPAAASQSSVGIFPVATWPC